ncbi:MAG TPA: GNAT family N-acetyltransferase [Paludibacteraceae bacterium]|mgnify:CR=1 FL=1|nr:GNAT family N-acetyltransferase [Paludibacteraceae bacterium]HQB68587.1 GNAT family N-acetyltransferase [Paludibacteraceae bacterium]HRS67091.1 GNAT family N-acetyltransferase [Paludibacteraceae bacterium]
MITLQPITNTDDILLTPLKALYESAFPVCERRQTEKLVQLIANEPRFSCVAIIYNDNFVGFFTRWDLDTFYYGEHFAISATMRGQKIGSQVLQNIVENLIKPFIIEVELPITNLAARRIAFYERANFTLCQTPYLQPPYEKGLESIPLHLMEYGGHLTQTHFSDVVRTLHTEIYGIKIA